MPICEQSQESISFIRQQCDIQPQIALILGSALGALLMPAGLIGLVKLIIVPRQRLTMPRSLHKTWY